MSRQSRLGKTVIYAGKPHIVIDYDRGGYKIQEPGTLALYWVEDNEVEFRDADVIAAKDKGETMTDKQDKPTQWLSTLDLETVIATDLIAGLAGGLIFLTFGTAYREIDSASEDDTIIKPVARIAVSAECLSDLAAYLIKVQARIAKLQDQQAIAEKDGTADE